MEPKNLRDALAAEMLGDLGKLHDKLTELDAITLPAFIAKTKTELAPIVGGILLAGQEYRQVLEEQSDKFKRKVVADVKADIETYKREILGEIANEVKNRIETPTDGLLQKLSGAASSVERAANRTSPNLWFVALASSVTTAVIFTGIGLTLHFFK